MSFNTGVIYEHEFYIRNESDRQPIKAWVDGLNLDAARGGRTYLCSTVRKALQRASTYAAEHPGEAVRFWALTDGMDNEDGPENQTSERLNKVLEEFPGLDEKSIQADLVIMGDLSLTITSKKNWFRASHDPEFEVAVPPLVQWSPEFPKVGEMVSFFDNSSAPYRFYDWRIDNQPTGATKAVKTVFTTEGTHVVRLIVTSTAGIKLEDARQVPVSPAEKPPKLVADFLVYPSMPEPGQEVELIGRPKGKPTRTAWFIDGKLVSTEETNRTVFVKDGRYEVKFRVEGEGGVLDEKNLVIAVQEPALTPRFTSISEAVSDQPVQFVNQTTGGQPGSFEWNFGDGTRSTEENPVHRFTATGNEPHEFEIQLEVTSRLGKRYKASPTRIKIWPPGPPPPKPIAAFHASATRVRVGTLITFRNESTGLFERSSWVFDRDGTLTNTSPDFSFSSPGEKLVVLTVAGPGGASSFTNIITVLSPEVNILLSWIDPQGKNAPFPQEINFDQIPLAHAKSSEYAHPPFDSMDITIPSELAPDAGISVELGGPATNGFILRRHLPNSEQLVGITNPIRDSGRYQLMVRRDAVEGDFPGTLAFCAVGSNVLLNGSTNLLQIPVKLQIGSRGSGGLVLVSLLALSLAIIWFLAKGRVQTKGLSHGQRMETVLEELRPGEVGLASPTAAKPKKAFILGVNDKIYLGNATTASIENTFDLGSPGSFLILQHSGLLLHSANGTKTRVLGRTDEFTLTDTQGKTRKVKLMMRAVPENKIVKSNHPTKP